MIKGNHSKKGKEQNYQRSCQIDKSNFETSVCTMLSSSSNCIDVSSPINLIHVRIGAKATNTGYLGQETLIRRTDKNLPGKSQAKTFPKSKGSLIRNI